MAEIKQPGAQSIVLRAALEVNKHEAGGMTKFRGVANSGEVIDHGWFTQFGIDLSTMRSREKIRILRNHDFDQEVGEATLINDNTKITLEDGRLFDHIEEAHVIDGILKQGGAYEFSIGMTGKMKRYEPPEERMLNGRMQTVQWLLYDGRIFETSFVPAGADENTFAEMLSVRLGGPIPPSEDDNEGDVMTKEELAAMEAKLAALEASNKALENTLTAERKAAKLATVKARLSEVGVTDEKSVAGFAELSDEAFASTLAALSASKKVDDNTRKALTNTQALSAEEQAALDRSGEQELRGKKVAGLAGEYVATGLTKLVDQKLATQQRRADAGLN
jgi:alkylhydroperoxidase family enzyme